MLLLLHARAVCSDLKRLHLGFCFVIIVSMEVLVDRWPPIAHFVAILFQHKVISWNPF